MRRLLLWMLLLFSGGGWAACTVSTVNASFGSVTSFALSGTGEVETTGTLVVACDAVLNLLTNDSVTLNYTAASVSGNSRATMKRTDNAAITDVIPTRLCGLSGCASSSEVQISKAYTWSGNTLLGLLGSKRYNIPLYFRTVPGQNVTAGPYQVLLTFSINYNVCSIGVLGLCTTPQTGTATTSILLNMNVTNDCSAMTTPDVNFSSAPLVQNFPTVSQAIAVTCTKGSTYTIGINNGANALNNVRRMVSGSNYLSYDIYKEATTNRWGSSGSERWTSATSSLVSADGLLRTYNYSAKVLTSQATPPAGTYTDTLIVDVAF
ncbi:MULTISPECIES: spore coat U domain-containing protein [unclassified Enterobacter cloacae complex]|uniref:Csu type fimbrial protein n=1 Tax=unclassified Enterobacter cloacae complex TaxID=2757714 RepID=UPI0018731C27|nr:MULTISPECIES: spore coat U domain-containing protein [unclassified Enterobacter cloacae complex]MBE4811758.1 spore coat protein U domain-containing protein [Enterobacter cloacae complex sp. P44RS]MBE4829136.1 spore coat protein U domain-containing protein [Enterobacter cloacae complex sp. P42RS]MBE4837793.1 spore coat protein U domain-containing protein [Enterobacter cloacae complex sp. P46RS]MBE4841854.1 spore coat protein U domain-containing protein [Enterobacter cloacae complex sp. P42C]